MTENQKKWSVLSIGILAAFISIYTGINFDWWLAGVVVLIIAIVTTLIPIVFGYFSFVELNDPGEWFDTAEQLGSEKERVITHYSRIIGTLRFWKSRAAAHHRLHLARVIWSLLSAVLLPVLVQFYDKSNTWAVLFMTILTTWTGIIVALAFTLKSEEKYQGYRQQESDFYDISRKLLDLSKRGDPKLEKKIDAYIEIVSEIRKIGRKVETGSPPSAI